MYIELKNVSYAYDKENYVLSDINLSIGKGQYITILGSNGSGKSTLNNLLSFLEKPSSGEIIIDGIFKKDIFLVFQNPTNQFVKTTVLEELVFGLENIQEEHDEITKKLNNIVDIFEIKELLHRDPYSLSGGEQQKVMLAANLLLEPKVLILDEALEMIDEKSKSKILDYLNFLKYEKQMSIVMVTHKMHDAALSDYIYVLNQGKLVLEGNTSEVFKEEEIITKARLEVPLAYFLSQYTNCNYEIVKDLNKFKEYYDKIK